MTHHLKLLAFVFLAVLPHLASSETVKLPWRNDLLEIPIPNGYVNGDQVDLYKKEFFRRTQSPQYAVILFLADKGSAGPDSNYGAVKVVYEQDRLLKTRDFSSRIESIKEAFSPKKMHQASQQANDRAKELGIPGRASPPVLQVIEVAVDLPEAYGVYVRSKRFFANAENYKEWTVVYLNASLLLRGREVNVLLYRTEHDPNDLKVLKELSRKWISELLELNP